MTAAVNNRYLDRLIHELEPVQQSYDPLFYLHPDLNLQEELPKHYNFNQCTGKHSLLLSILSSLTEKYIMPNMAKRMIIDFFDDLTQRLREPTTKKGLSQQKITLRIVEEFMGSYIDDPKSITRDQTKAFLIFLCCVLRVNILLIPNDNTTKPVIVNSNSNLFDFHQPFLLLDESGEGYYSTKKNGATFHLYFSDYFLEDMVGGRP